MFESVTDSEIEAAIAQNDINHEDTYETEEIRDALDRINKEITSNWNRYQDSIDDGAHEVIHEDSKIIVMVDHTGEYWDKDLSAINRLDDDDSVLSSIVISLHHDAATRHCEYSFSESDPYIVEKPNVFRSGEYHFLREIARRTEEFGSVARAVDTLATETHGWSKNAWAKTTGRNPSTVTRTTKN